MSKESFSDLGVSESTVAALARRSIHTPFSIQSLVIPDALAGNDVLAKSPTGSGKTLAFAASDRPATGRRLTPVRLPSSSFRPGSSLTRSRRSSRRSGARRACRVTAVYGGTSVSAQGKAAKSAHILVATPGRLEDLANRRLVKLDDIRILVLDEADRMLDMGFQPQVDAIVRRLPRKRQTMFFSATLDGEVAELARAYTHNPSRFDASSRARSSAARRITASSASPPRTRWRPSSRCSATTTA